MTILLGAMSWILCNPGAVTADGVQDAGSGRRELIRRHLGQNVARAGVEREADLNGDGVVNILDVAQLRIGSPPNGHVEVGHASGASEQIVIAPVSATISAGSSGSVRFLIQGNTTPILGYSLEIAFVKVQGADVVEGNIVATNFFDAQNLITAGGATRDPFFSVIQGDGNGGVFVNTITDDNSAVLAVDGVNDVFVELHFDASDLSCGTFAIELGPATALSDMNTQSIPYTFNPGSITVEQCFVPAASTYGLINLGLGLMVVGTMIMRRNSPLDV